MSRSQNYETTEEINAHILSEHPNAPICKGCGFVLIGNEHMWKREGRDTYCSQTCQQKARP